MTTLRLVFANGSTCTITTTGALDIEQICALLSPLHIQEVVLLDDAPPYEDMTEDADECPCPVCQKAKHPNTH